MPFEPVPGAQMSWITNALGASVTRLYTKGAMLTVVRGKQGDVVPAHGYTYGSITYVVSGAIEIEGTQLRAGDAGCYTPGGYFAVRFVEDSVYVVARHDADELTLPDVGERSAAFPDA